MLLTMSNNVKKCSELFGYEKQSKPGISVKVWHHCGEPQFGAAPLPIVLWLWLWCFLTENCGRDWGCGAQNLQIVVVVEVGW